MAHMVSTIKARAANTQMMVIACFIISYSGWFVASFVWHNAFCLLCGLYWIFPCYVVGVAHDHVSGLDDNESGSYVYDGDACVGYCAYPYIS